MAFKRVAAPAASALRTVDREAMVKEALENSELLARYHLVSKAVAELERVLEIYPDETDIHRRLVGMCWKDMPERAEQAAQALARIYTQQGDAEGARRFAQMAGGREAAPAVAVPPPVVRVPAVSPKPLPPLPAQPAASTALDPSIPLTRHAPPPASVELPLDFETLPPSAPPPAPSSEIQEIDLSAEPTTGFTASASAPASPLSGPLEEMCEAPATEPVEDDPETHYYLGVAFWEMNLLDEAIGEFQKVVKGAGKGPHSPNYLQACTLLATYFMDKGMAPLAVKWYGRALETPHLDEEAWLAFQYDLGVAYEQAGDLPRALERFSEVYSQNIDFRDVTEKIRTLQQKGS